MSVESLSSRVKKIVKAQPNVSVADLMTLFPNEKKNTLFQTLKRIKTPKKQKPTKPPIKNPLLAAKSLPAQEKGGNPTNGAAGPNKLLSTNNTPPQTSTPNSTFSLSDIEAYIAMGLSGIPVDVSLLKLAIEFKKTQDSIASERDVNNVTDEEWEKYLNGDSDEKSIEGNSETTVP